jgi:hypothetical protein
MNAKTVQQQRAVIVGTIGIVGGNDFATRKKIPPSDARRLTEYTAQFHRGHIMRKIEADSL